MHEACKTTKGSLKSHFMLSKAAKSACERIAYLDWINQEVQKSGIGYNLKKKNTAEFLWLTVNSKCSVHMEPYMQLNDLTASHLTSDWTMNRSQECLKSRRNNSDNDSE